MTTEPDDEPEAGEGEGWAAFALQVLADELFERAQQETGLA